MRPMQGVAEPSSKSGSTTTGSEVENRPSFPHQKKAHIHNLTRLRANTFSGRFHFVDLNRHA